MRPMWMRFFVKCRDRLGESNHEELGMQTPRAGARGVDKAHPSPLSLRPGVGAVDTSSKLRIVPLDSRPLLAYFILYVPVS